MRHLWRNQKYLRNLQFNFALLSPSLEDVLGEEASTLRSLKYVEEIDVNLGASLLASDADLLLRFFQPRDLKKVSMSAISRNSRDRSFGILHFNRYLPATLTHLTLDSITLPPPEHLQLDLFPGLIYLNMQCYYKCGPVLDAFRKPNLREFNFYYDVLGDDGIDEVVGMLARFGTLEKLTIQFPYARLRLKCQALALGILMHTQNLTSLFLRCRSLETSEFFEEVAIRCRKLRQLAFTFEYYHFLDFCRVQVPQP